MWVYVGYVAYTLIGLGVFAWCIWLEWRDSDPDHWERKR
jgi:hypothetical protein